MELKRAATIIAVRADRAPVEVLLIKRASTVSLPGFWTFPGGREEPTDALLAQQTGVLSHEQHLRVEDRLRHLAITAWREFGEEVGAGIAPSPDDVADALIPLSHWVTPAALKRRYDTVYYITDAPVGDLSVDTNEVEEARWWRPADYLRAVQSAEIPATPPVIRTMIDLDRHPDPAAILAWARNEEVIEVEPVLQPGDTTHVYFPGHPAHPAATSIGAPHSLRSQAGRWEW